EVDRSLEVRALPAGRDDVARVVPEPRAAVLAVGGHERARFGEEERDGLATQIEGALVEMEIDRRTEERQEEMQALAARVVEVAVGSCVGRVDVEAEHVGADGLDLEARGGRD